MLPAPAGDCDDCVPSYLRARGAGLAGAASSALPLAATFVLWLLVGSRTLFPLLAGGRQARGRRQQVSRAVFAATVALSALLAELVLCEIVGLLDGRARARALRLVLAALLLALLVVVPALEMRSVAAAVTGMLACPVPPGAVEAAGLLVWLLAFWYLGVAVPGTGMPSDRPGPGTDAFISACLERVAVIGIALMAGLAGFAATSALWQTFGRRSREVRAAR